MVRRFLLRCGVVFAVVLIAPFPLDYVLKLDPLLAWYGDAWEWLVRHFADLIGVAVPPTMPTGSGDTTAAWVGLLMTAVLALVGAAIWTALVRGRPVDPRVRGATRVYLRYWLGATMLGYGFAKVFKTQFPFPFPDKLEEPVAELSPMGLLWAFMGYSTPYNLFTGGMECLGGALLLFRRTTTLGALILIAVLTNVVVLNFCYDVPVKQFSTTLLLVAIALAWRDLGRLAAALFGLPTRGRFDERMPLARRWRIAAGVAKVLLIGLVLYAQIKVELAYEGELSEIAGRWEVVSFDGPDAAWTALAIGRSGVVYTHGASIRHKLHVEDKKLALDDRKLTYVLAGDTLTIDGDKLHVVLHRRPSGLLETRGFNWVTEFPFNR